MKNSIGKIFVVCLFSGSTGAHHVVKQRGSRSDSLVTLSRYLFRLFCRMIKKNYCFSNKLYRLSFTIVTHTKTIISIGIWQLKNRFDDIQNKRKRKRKKSKLTNSIISHRTNRLTRTVSAPLSTQIISERRRAAPQPRHRARSPRHAFHLGRRRRTGASSERTPRARRR